MTIQFDDDKNNFGFNETNETLNGRVAMLGFVALVGTEALLGHGILVDSFGLPALITTSWLDSSSLILCWLVRPIVLRSSSSSSKIDCSDAHGFHNFHYFKFVLGLYLPSLAFKKC
eukprot:g82080.t1